MASGLVTAITLRVLNYCKYLSSWVYTLGRANVGHWAPDTCFERWIAAKNNCENHRRLIIENNRKIKSLFLVILRINSNIHVIDTFINRLSAFLKVSLSSPVHNSRTTQWRQHTRMDPWVLFILHVLMHFLAKWQNQWVCCGWEHFDGQKCH